MITNCNYRIIKNKDASSVEILIESVKGIDSTTIMVASFDNQFTEMKDKKNVHQK